LACPQILKDPVVDFDEPYLSLGEKKQDRQAAYAQYVCDTVPEDKIKLIRDALQRGPFAGSEPFRREVSRRLGIHISNKGPARPQKANK